MSESRIKCGACGSMELRFRERQSNPIFLNISIQILSLQTVFKRRKGILKCLKCGYETTIKQKKVIV